MTQEEFSARVLSICGQPYSRYDCIAVVRFGAQIQCQGTNWLWRSITNSPKYRYLVERSTKTLSPDQYQSGLLMFRIRTDAIPKGYNDPPDCHHVGVLVRYCDDWQVVQSNPGPGVHVSKFNPFEWNGWGKLKQIDYADVVPGQDPVHDQPETGDLSAETYRMVKTLYDAYMRGLK